MSCKYFKVFLLSNIVLQVTTVIDLRNVYPIFAALNGGKNRSYFCDATLISTEAALTCSICQNFFPNSTEYFLDVELKIAEARNPKILKWVKISEPVSVIRLEGIPDQFDSYHDVIDFDKQVKNQPNVRQLLYLVKWIEEEMSKSERKRFVLKSFPLHWKLNFECYTLRVFCASPMEIGKIGGYIGGPMMHENVIIAILIDIQWHENETRFVLSRIDTNRLTMVLNEIGQMTSVAMHRRIMMFSMLLSIVITVIFIFD